MLSERRAAGHFRWQHGPLAQRHKTVRPSEALTCLGILLLTSATAHGSGARMGVEGLAARRVVADV